LVLVPEVSIFPEEFLAVVEEKSAKAVALQ
jgi:hypothetical protein